MKPTDHPNFTRAMMELRGPKYHEYGTSFVVPMCLLLSVAMVLAVGGNIMVILTIIRHKNMRTRTNMFIISLAVADILVAICDMPFSILTLIKGDWVFGDSFCEFNGVTMSLFMVASIQTLMFISIHKYISITRPFSRFMTPRRIIGMIAFTWVWSFAYAIGAALGWTQNVYKKGASQCGPVYPSNSLQMSHSICNTMVNFTIPLIAMCFCYTNIFCEIRRHMSRMRENTNIDMKNSIMQQKRISVTLFVVLICFLICWSPYIIYSSYAAFIKDKEAIPIIANPLAYWCGYINSACNPIIYAFRSPSFRQGYYSIVCGTRQRHYHSSGSFSQRSPSFRKRSIHVANNVNNTLEPRDESMMETTARPTDDGTKSYSPAEEKKKKKTKRLLSMNSWASIRLPPLGRQLSSPSPVEPMANVADTTWPQDELEKIETNNTVTTPNCETQAQAGLSLSPILEGSQEDVSNPVRVAVDIGYAVTFSCQDEHRVNEYI